MPLEDLDARVDGSVERSPTFPAVPKKRLSAFWTAAKEDEMGAIKALRTWWAEQIERPTPKTRKGAVSQSESELEI
ncbi:MAG: hypothetical protein AAGG51_10540 [Cyanobacteria bacterium P01_G01_bin.54]